jgi:cobalt/nickel transport system ATP-binding protein
MDEPTSDLDPMHAEMIEKIILGLRKEHGISIVLATHDMDMAARLSDRICLVKNGSIIADGMPSEIFYDHELLREAGLKQPYVARIYESLPDMAGGDDRPVTAEHLISVISGMVVKR